MPLRRSSAFGQEDALVPQLWHIEIRNCLLVARRRRRLSGDDLRKRLRALAGLPVRTKRGLRPRLFVRAGG